MQINTQMLNNKTSYPRLPRRKKQPPIKQLLSKDLFFSNYDKLYKALLSKNKKFTHEHWISLIEPTVPVVPYEKRIHKSKSEKSLDSSPNIGKEIAQAFKEYSSKSKLITKEYKEFNNANNAFISMYRNLKRSQSAIDIQKKYTYIKKDEDDPDRTRLTSSQGDKLFKKSPLLIHHKNEMNLHFVGNTEWIKPNELKYIKSMNNLKDFLEYKELLNSNKNMKCQSDDIKLNNSNFVKNYSKNIQKEKMRLDNEFHIKIQQYRQNHLSEINKTKESLLSLNDINIHSIKQNRHSMHKRKASKCALIKKPNNYKHNININLNESNNQSIISVNQQCNNAKQLNSTSSTLFNSPNSTLHSSFYNNPHMKKHSTVKHFHKSRTFNSNLTFLNKHTFTPTNSSKLISFSPSNVTAVNSNGNERSGDEMKVKSYSSSSKCKEDNLSKVENVYNKIQSASNANESSSYIQQYLGKDVIAKWNNNPKHRSQIYFLINSAKLKASSSNIQNKVYKLYESQIPQNTKYKFEMLTNAENTINKFDFKFFKAIIDSNIK